MDAGGPGCKMLATLWHGQPLSLRMLHSRHGCSSGRPVGCMQGSPLGASGGVRGPWANLQAEGRSLT